MKFHIKFDEPRYKSSQGAILFGKNITLECENIEQAKEIAIALSMHCDAGLTDQFYVEEDEER